MDSNYQQDSTLQSTLQQENISANPQPENSKQFNKKKILIIVVLCIIFLPILYIIIKLSLTGEVIYKNLSKLPKPTPQTNYINTPTGSDDRLEQLRKQARNELRKVDIDTIAKGLETYYSNEEQEKYSIPKNEWFAAGISPKDPLGNEYIGIPKTNVSSFNICATLEDATPDQYCVKSKH